MAQTQIRPPLTASDGLANRTSSRSGSLPAASPLAGGLAAGAIAAIAVDLLSLPLRSPHDGLFNTLTVGLGALLLGAISGVALKVLDSRPGRMLPFAVLYLALAAITIGAAAFAESMLIGTLAFVLPAAAVAFAITGVLSFPLSSMLVGRWWIASGAVAVALALSVVLADRGDTQRTSLVIPDAAPVVTAAPVVVAEPPVAPVVQVQPTAVAAAPAAPAAVATAAPKPASRVAGQYAGVNFIVGTGSKGTFTVNEQIARTPVRNDAVVSTTALTGEVHLDGRPSTIKLELWKLASDQPTRDRYIKNNMFPNTQFAEFTVDSATVSEKAPLGEAATKAPVTGTLTLGEKKFPIAFEMFEGRDDGDVIYLLGKSKFTWQELGIEPPSSTGIVQINDDVAVEILVAARPKSGS